MSICRIDPQDENEDGVVLVKPSGRARAERPPERADVAGAADIRATRTAAFVITPVRYGLERAFQGRAHGAQRKRPRRARAGEGSAP